MEYCIWCKLIDVCPFCLLIRSFLRSLVRSSFLLSFICSFVQLVYRSPVRSFGRSVFWSFGHLVGHSFGGSFVLSLNINGKFMLSRIMDMLVWCVKTMRNNYNVCRKNLCLLKKRKKVWDTRWTRYRWGALSSFRNFFKVLNFAKGFQIKFCSKNSLFLSRLYCEAFYVEVASSFRFWNSKSK